MLVSTLAGKVALVTGAGRGVGRATALELARAGARVALVARSGDELEESSDRLRECGATAFVVQADLGDLDGITEITRRVSRGLGSVDILINNAATSEPVGASVSLDPAAWTAAIKINVVAAATLAFSVLPAMLERQWGRVVNVSSGVVEDPTGMIRANAYQTSKAALEAHTLNLAAELADTGVTVNVYRPGAVDTAMFDLLCDSPAMVGSREVREWALRVRAEGELTTPDESARSLVAHLYTDASGQIWDVSDVV